jgi:hypothetical protein
MAEAHVGLIYSSGRVPCFSVPLFPWGALARHRIPLSPFGSGLVPMSGSLGRLITIFDGPTVNSRVAENLHVEFEDTLNARGSRHLCALVETR